jgi:hypothetical protein
VANKSIPITLLLAFTCASLALVTVIGLVYGYDSRSRAEALAGFIILIVALGVLWFSSSRPVSFTKNVWNERAAGYGIAIGLLWLVEICINNLAAPRLPYRDWIDNVFWATVALCILVLAAASAYQANSIRRGILTGLWSGFASGMLACWTALMLVVFGMHFILSDPLNVAEWSLRGAGNPAASMAAYFAFETFAGAMMHLIILGIVMGAFLGVAGGLTGKLARKIRSSTM